MKKTENDDIADSFAYHLMRKKKKAEAEKSLEALRLYSAGCRALFICPKDGIPVSDSRDEDSVYIEHNFGYATLSIVKDVTTSQMQEFVVEFWTDEAGTDKDRDNDYFDNAYDAIGAVLGHIVSKMLPKTLRIQDHMIQNKDKYQGSVDEI